MFLRHQKKDAEGKVPIYVHVTIDGDDEDFSLSRKIRPSEWSQPKQKCIGKSADALAINTKIDKTRGELIALFDRFQPGAHQVIKARRLIKMYQGQNPDTDISLQKRDPVPSSGSPRPSSIATSAFKHLEKKAKNPGRRPVIST